MNVALSPDDRCARRGPALPPKGLLISHTTRKAWQSAKQL